MATPVAAQPGGTNNQAEWNGAGTTAGVAAPTQARADAGSTFQGHRTPFRVETTGAAKRIAQGVLTYGLSELTGQVHKYYDADNQPVPKDVYDAWVAAGSPAPAAPSTSANPYTTPGGDPTRPTGPEQDAAVGKIIDASNTPPPDTAALAAALAAGKLGPTTVAQAGPTTIDTAQSDQARGLQQQNIGDLQRSAQGQGPAADLARARLAQALRRSGAQTAGLVLGATGQNRKAGLLQAALANSEAGLNAGESVAQIEAQDRQQAQAQLGQVLQGVRGQDIGLATSQAGLTQQSTLANTGAVNDAAQRDADRALNYGEFSAKYGVELEDLRLRVGDFQQKAAQGVLDAGNKQEAIRQARRGLDIAEEKLRKIDIPAAERAAAEADRNFFLQAIATLAGVGAKVAAAAAHGGLVTRPTNMLVGEAGPELIVPVDDDVPARLARALSVQSRPFDRGRGEAPDLSRLLAALKGMKGDEPATAPAVPPKVVIMLAASNVKARKEAR